MISAVAEKSLSEKRKNLKEMAPEVFEEYIARLA